MSREPKKDLGATIIERLSEFEQDLRDQVPIAKKYTVRTLRLNLSLTPYDGEKVKQLRKTMGLSQSLFARFLGVKVDAVQSWEQDRRSPSKMACRFMDEMAANPQFFLDRLFAESQIES